MTTPDISIVVCTHNRAAMLRDALTSLAPLQTAGRFSYEVVVVDNASTDHTPNVVTELQAILDMPLRYIHEPKKGIASARNRGLREAAGEWIAFFDDDQLADPSWLLELFTYAQQYNLRAVGGAVHLKLPVGCTRDLHSFPRMLLGESRHGNQPFEYSPKISPGAGNLMLHRSVFEQVGAFNESFAMRAEDTELYCRIWQAGIEAWYVPNAIVQHVTPSERLEPAYLDRLAVWMGGSVAQRERDTHSLPLYVVRWLAKSLLAGPLLRVKLLLAQLKNQAETQAGLGYQLKLAREYARRGAFILKQELQHWWPQLGWFRRTAKPA